jgi:hypothetical protein
MYGTSKMISKLKTVATSHPKLVASGLYAEAQIEVTEMKRRTPVDTTEDAPHPGNLRNSIHAEEPAYAGKTVYVLIATGAQAPYAIWVHENPDAFHPIGQWKYMESVINEARAYIAARIAKRIHLDKIA